MPKLSQKEIDEINKAAEDAEINGLSNLENEPDIDWSKVDPDPNKKPN